MRSAHASGDDADMITPLLYLHIAAGSIVLASMFIPVITRKGGPLHRRAGWVFVVSMVTVSISAVLLSVVRLLFEPANTTSALFLGYLGILTGSQTSVGVRVVRTKSRAAASRNWWDLSLAAALLGGGIGLFVYGLRVEQPLLRAFSIVGMVTGAANLWFWRRTPGRMQWWFEHMNAMLGGCIGGTTAFLVQMANRIGGEASLLMWLAPTIVGVPAIAIWNVYYHRKFETGHAVTSAAAILQEN
jgi:uncharacterized membrane protein